MNLKFIFEEANKVFNIQNRSKFTNFQASPSMRFQDFGPYSLYQLLELVNLVTPPVASMHLSLGHLFWEMFLESCYFGLQHDKPISSYNERMAKVLLAEYINYILISVSGFIIRESSSKTKVNFKDNYRNC